MPTLEYNPFPSDQKNEYEPSAKIKAVEDVVAVLRAQKYESQPSEEMCLAFLVERMEKTDKTLWGKNVADLIVNEREVFEKGGIAESTWELFQRLRDAYVAYLAEREQVAETPKRKESIAMMRKIFLSFAQQVEKIHANHQPSPLKGISVSAIPEWWTNRKEEKK